MVSHVENRAMNHPFIDDVEFAASDSASCSDYTAYETGDDSLSNIDEDGVFLYRAGDEDYRHFFYDNSLNFGGDSTSIYPISKSGSGDLVAQRGGPVSHVDANQMAAASSRRNSEISSSPTKTLNHANRTRNQANKTQPVDPTPNPGLPLQITQETIDKVRETELEDVLQNARDISHPDPQAKMSFCSRPSKLVDGTFRHLLSVKELHSTTGAFKYRNIEIHRQQDAELGFSVRQGDGWEKKEGIFVSRLSLGSPFDLYELISIGDEVVKINTVDVKKMNVDDVVRLMHLPEKLTITIKILTPFSKKRVAKSNIARNAVSKKFVGKSKRTQDSNYKIANMKIGKTVEESAKKKAQENSSKAEVEASSSLSVTSSSNAKKSTTPATNTTTSTGPGRSPYRALPNGFTTPNRHLSPIREAKSEAHLAPNGDATNSSSVSWSDRQK